MLRIPGPMPTHADQSHTDTILVHNTSMLKKSCIGVLARPAASLRQRVRTEYGPFTKTPPPLITKIHAIDGVEETDTHIVAEP